MAKNPLITDEVKRVIAEMYLKHPDWRAKEIRDGVEAKLREQNPRSKPGWPGLSAIQKELTKQRKTDDARPPESKELDEPWNLSTLSRYELPPDSVPIVLFICNHKWFKRERALTIREAQWIGRLYALLPEYGRANPNSFYELEAWAKEYALMDELTDLSGLPPPPNRCQSLEDWVFSASKVIRKYEADGNALFPSGEVKDGLSRISLYFSTEADSIKRQMVTPLHPNARFIDKRVEAKYRKALADQEKSNKAKEEAQHERPHSQEG